MTKMAIPDSIKLAQIVILRTGEFYFRHEGEDHGPFQLNELADGWTFVSGPSLNGNMWSAIIRRNKGVVEAEQPATIDSAILTICSVSVLYQVQQDMLLAPSNVFTKFILELYKELGTRSVGERDEWARLNTRR